VDILIINISILTIHIIVISNQESLPGVGHYLLPSHSYKLSLNDSPYCTKDPEEVICDLSLIILSYISLSSNHLILFNFLKSQNIQCIFPFEFSTLSHKNNVYSCELVQQVINFNTF